MWNKLKEGVLEVFLPRACVGCGQEGKYICEKCSIFISEASLICPVCQKESLSGERHKDCQREYDLDGLVNVWEYEGIIKKLIEQVKREGISQAIPELVENSFLTILKDKSRFSSFISFLLSGDTYITYVPMEKEEERQRGFNQAALMAQRIGELTGKEVKGFLEEGTGLYPQALLVDDFWVSGKTMKKQCQELKKVGLKKVWGFTLARIA